MLRERFAQVLWTPGNHELWTRAKNARADAVEQLAGAPLPASAIESLVLPARLPGYTPALLDELTAAVRKAVGAPLAGGVGARALVGAKMAIGLWNGVLVALLDIQPIIATLILMVAGRGIAQLITEGVILTFNDQGLIFVGSGILFGVPMPVVLWVLIALAVGLAQVAHPHRPRHLLGLNNLEQARRRHPR